MSLRSPEYMPRFSAFLMTCKQWRVRRIYTCPCTFWGPKLGFKPKSKYPWTRHKLCPDGDDL